MSKVMIFRDVKKIKGGSYFSYSDINDPDIDNLDDLLIEYSDEELVIVDDNYQSPASFPYVVERKHQKRGTTRVVLTSSPDHPLHDAYSLEDWLRSNRLCASEIGFKNGIIQTEDTWNHNLKEL